MPWSHRRKDTPAFIWDAGKLLRAEWLFLSEAGLTAGAARRLSSERQGVFAVRVMAENVRASFEIDGECLDIPRLEHCIRRSLGVALDDGGCGPPESLAAELAVSVSREYRTPISMQTILKWQSDFARRGDGALFPVSPAGKGSWDHDQRMELKRFLRWFNNSEPADEASPLLRAGLAHLWFESIHVYPEGSGVLGRALAEKALLQGLPGHNFTPLSLVLARYRNDYHHALDDACRDRDATAWLMWFAAAAIEAGRRQRTYLDFAAHRARMLDSLMGRINGRQSAILDFLFDRGPEGIDVGFGAPEFSRLFHVPLAAIKRDLTGLLSLGALVRRVKGRLVRYHLPLTDVPVPRVLPRDIA